MGKNIEDILDKIIIKRTEKAENRERQKSKISKWNGEMERFLDVYRKIEQLTFEEQENLFGKQTAGNLQAAKKLAEECRETCQCAMDSLERLQIRFRRPTIDLVVIGKVGSGKSHFLQSATGKGDDCIPSLPGTSCTGVRSVIENMEGSDTKAYFTFKTAEEVRQDINSELKYRVKKLQKIFPVEQIYAQEVPDLTAGQIRQSLEHLKNQAGKLEKNYPDLEVGKKDDVKTCIKEIDRLMEAYTEERSRKEWEPYLGISEPGAGKQGLKDLELLEMESGKLQYMLSKSENIKLFVSKQNHCRYIAVKDSVIKTNIEGVDGRIRLVDTVGIGDPSADTMKQVQDAARNESDGVIFICPYRVRYPESGPDEEDKPLFETLNEIFLEHQKSDARYWMAFLQNHLKEIPRKCSEDYLKVLESSAYDIFKEKEGISYRNVIDVSSHEEVKSMLEGFLDQMARHLQSIDDHLEKESDSLLEQAGIQRNRLKQKLGTVRVNLPQQQSDDYLYSMVENHMLNLLAELKNYSSAIVSKSREKQGKSFLQQRIDMVRELKKGEELQKIVEDSCKYVSGIAKARQISIESLKKAVRRIATFPSEEQEKIEKDYKEKTAELFVKCVPIDLDKMGDCTVHLKVQDDDFFRRMGEELFGRSSHFEELKEYFDSLDRFRLDEMNGLTKALFYHHAEKSLTDEPYKEHSAEHGEESKDFEAGSLSADDEMEALVNQLGNTGTGTKAEHSFSEEMKDTISSEDKGRLKIELQNMLEMFIQEVKNDTGDEQYLVGYYDQMNEELRNFMQISGKEYWGLWFMVYKGMKKRDILKEEEDAEKKERRRLLVNISKEADNFFSNEQLFQ